MNEALGKILKARRDEASFISESRIREFWADRLEKRKALCWYTVKKGPASSGLRCLF